MLPVIADTKSWGMTWQECLASKDSWRIHDPLIGNSSTQITKTIYCSLVMILGSKFHANNLSESIKNISTFTDHPCFSCQGVCKLRAEHKDTIISRSAADELRRRSCSYPSYNPSLQRNRQRKCLESTLWRHFRCSFFQQIENKMMQIFIKINKLLQGIYRTVIWFVILTWSCCLPLCFHNLWATKTKTKCITSVAMQLLQCN